jgi:prolyl oligopeptidase
MEANMRQRVGVLVLGVVFASSGPVLAQASPPTAAVRDVTDTYFGKKVVDPYRWMEDTKSPEFASWLKGENDYTRAVLAKIPGRATLAERIKALDDAGAAVASVQWAEGRYFYFKTEPGSDNRKLFVRDRLDAPERLLLDTEKQSTKEKHYSIDYFTPSLDGSYVAAGVSSGGSENSVLEVIESATGKDLPDRIERAEFGGVSWRKDGKSFYYTRLAKLAADAPPTDKYLKSRVFLHTLGSNPDDEPAVFGFGVSDSVTVAPPDFSFVLQSPASPWILGVVAHGVQNELTLYTAPADSVHGAATPWHKIVDVDDAVTSADLHGDTAYLLSHKDASRFRIETLDLAHPGSKPAVIVPPSDAVIRNLGVAKDALYVQDLDAGMGRLRRVGFVGGPAEVVALPFSGAIQGFSTDARLDGPIVQITSWTESPRWYSWSTSQRGLIDTKLVPKSPVDFSGITSVEVKAKSADGTMVPLSIVSQKGIAMDGSHPTYLVGYGAYGITYDPAFVPTNLAWLERGGVLAIAHVRGGGEYGEDWHRAGMLATKPHTIDDFIACGEYLVENKYTTPQRLSGEGTSAGGVTIGGAITRRPDLFGAALIRVGDSDALRSETMESGPANIPEFGTVTTEVGFQALWAMDAYQHVKDHTAYPGVMLTTGANDPRVAPWQAAKMAARLQAATSSGKPILLRVDYDAGHGLGSTKSQRDEQRADEFAFLFWQLGTPGFQPK